MNSFLLGSLESKYLRPKSQLCILIISLSLIITPLYVFTLQTSLINLDPSVDLPPRENVAESYNAVS